MTTAFHACDIVAPKSQPYRKGVVPLDDCFRCVNVAVWGCNDFTKEINLP